MFFVRNLIVYKLLHVTHLKKSTTTKKPGKRRIICFSYYRGECEASFQLFGSSGNNFEQMTPAAIDPNTGPIICSA